MLRSMDTELAPVTSHCRVADCPRFIVAGVALKLTITGGARGFTVKVTDADTLSEVPTAVSL